MAEETIDLESWLRLDRYRHFRRYGRPQFAITAPIDVTHLVTVLKPKGLSPFRATMFAIGAAIHQIPEVRTRLRGDAVVQHDAVRLSVTVPSPNDGFTYAGLPYLDNFDAFDAECEKVLKPAGQQPYMSEIIAGDDVVYLSCAPWVSFTSANNPMMGPDDCIPRIVWGRMAEAADGKWSMPLSVELHHALADGVHAAAIFRIVEETLGIL
ncbi:CatA-like O-acetyltransferase [Halovulum sp. GXIMD14793]